MAKVNADINMVYIPERLRQRLRGIETCRLTTVVAPMGYGKTTAVNWCLARRQRAGDRVLRMSIYSDSAALFWQSFRAAFRGTAAEDALARMDIPQDGTALGLLKEALSAALREDGRPWYFFADDCHLLGDDRLLRLLLTLAELPAEDLHLVLASRDALFSRGEELRFGNRLLRLTMRDLRLRPAELADYSRRCGLALTEPQLRELDQISEGWFSAVYLNLRSYEESRRLLSGSHDIYEMMTVTLLDTLTEPERTFLLRLSPVDEFTEPQAAYLTELPESGAILRRLSSRNAFVQRLPDGATYRFHHMLKDCARQQFDALPEPERRAILCRCGAWHEDRGEYLRAMRAYRRGGDDRAVLRMIGRDGGVQLASGSPEELVTWLDRCDPRDLMAEPRGLLVLMRRLFSWRQIAWTRRIGELIRKAAEREDLPREERDNLLGELDLILSFLHYNDIVGMSVYHRGACRRMTRPAVSIGRRGSYTFGAPSVLMMFHRAAGTLEEELAAMRESMPYYYRLTEGHGRGAESVMEAEARCLQGRFLDSRIALEKARHDAAASDQQYILLCCDMLSLRLALCGELPYDEDWYARRREELRPAMDPMELKVLDGVAAAFYALLGESGGVPESFRRGGAAGMGFLAPARPMYEIIENQVLLARGDYERLLARSEATEALCAAYPYALCLLHLAIQRASALAMLGKTEEARAELRGAAELAARDELSFPFAENAVYLGELLTECLPPELAARALEQGRRVAAVRRRLRTDDVPEALRTLSETERSICALVAQRRSNREIAGELFLSEGTVKQYLNQLYAKLGLEGGGKRRALADLWQSG